MSTAQIYATGRASTKLTRPTLFSLSSAHPCRNPSSKLLRSNVAHRRQHGLEFASVAEWPTQQSKKQKAQDELCVVAFSYMWA